MSKKGKLKKLYKKEQVNQKEVEIIEAIKETDNWNENEIGVSREVFNSIYTSFVNLDKAEPMEEVDSEIIKENLKRLGLSVDEYSY